MSKSFTWREKQVLFHIVNNPDYTDRSIADKTGLKLSTVTAIRRRLNEKGFFNVIRLPWLHELGAELMAVNYSVYKATSPQELRIKTSKKFASAHAEVFWAINEYVQSVAFNFSRNYTDIRSNISELEQYYTDHGFLDEEGINLLVFPFDLAIIPYFFDYAPMLAQSFGISLDDEFNGNGNGLKKPSRESSEAVKLSRTSSLVYYNLVKHPEMTDTELADEISISQRTITKLRKKFEKDGLLKTVVVPDLKKLGFTMMVFDHAKLNLKVPADQRAIILQSLLGIKPPITFIIGSSDVVALTVYEDFDTYRRSINRFAEVYEFENIFIKEPRRLMFSISEMQMIKDHVYAPLVAKILDIEE